MGSGDGESPKGTEKERARAPQIGGKGGSRGEGDQFRPILSMMRFPPIRVPRAIQQAQSRTSQRGTTKVSGSQRPWERAVTSKKTPRNFCPSWAPWRKARAAAPRICPRRQNPGEGRRDPEGPGRLAAQSPAQQEGEGQAQQHPVPGNRAEVGPSAGKGQSRPSSRPGGHGSRWWGCRSARPGRPRGRLPPERRRARHRRRRDRRRSQQRRRRSRPLWAGRTRPAVTRPDCIRRPGARPGGRGAHRRPRLWRWHWAHRSIR